MPHQETGRHTKGLEDSGDARKEPDYSGNILANEEWKYTDPCLRKLFRKFQTSRRAAGKQAIVENCKQTHDHSWESSSGLSLGIGNTDGTTLVESNLEGAGSRATLARGKASVPVMDDECVGRASGSNRIQSQPVSRTPNVETSVEPKTIASYGSGDPHPDAQGHIVTFAYYKEDESKHNGSTNEVFRRTRFTLAQRLTDLRKGWPHIVGWPELKVGGCGRCLCITLTDHIRRCPHKGKTTIGSFCNFCWTVVMTLTLFRQHSGYCPLGAKKLVETTMNRYAFREEGEIQLTQCRGCKFLAHVPALLQAHEPLCAAEQLLHNCTDPIPMLALEYWLFDGQTLTPPDTLYLEVMGAITRVQLRFPSVKFRKDFSFREAIETVVHVPADSPCQDLNKRPWEPDPKHSWKRYLLDHHPQDVGDYGRQWAERGAMSELTRQQQRAVRQAWENRSPEGTPSDRTCEFNAATGNIFNEDTRSTSTVISDLGKTLLEVSEASSTTWPEADRACDDSMREDARVTDQSSRLARTESSDTANIETFGNMGYGHTEVVLPDSSTDMAARGEEEVPLRKKAVNGGNGTTVKTGLPLKRVVVRLERLPNDVEYVTIKAKNKLTADTPVKRIKVHKTQGNKTSVSATASNRTEKERRNGRPNDLSHDLRKDTVTVQSVAKSALPSSLLEGLAIVLDNVTCELSGYMTVTGEQPHGMGKATYRGKECAAHCERFGAGSLPHPAGIDFPTTMQLYQLNRETGERRPCGTLSFAMDVSAETELDVTCGNKTLHLERCSKAEKDAWFKKKEIQNP